MNEIAPGVAVLPISIVNVYFIGEPGKPWLLVDTGLPQSAEKIRAAAEERYGAGAKPEAIVLTHGHPDHAGSAFDLAIAWDVPIYAHSLEMPYLTGKALYPPSDPTLGGAMAFLSRFFPASGLDLRPPLQELPPGGGVPALADWTWLHTPGHAPGHVSFYREGDRTLLAGDACATVNMESLGALLAKTQELCGPPAPATYDWGAAHQSVRRLAALKPAVLGCGHGVPLRGADVASRLAALADEFPVPPHGRYVSEPARTDENGIVFLPAPPPDPLPGLFALGGVGLALIVGMIAFGRRQKKTRP